MKMGQLYIGTSGYTNKDWRLKFYPKGVAQKDWLHFYAEHYNAVEINATFYRPFPASVYNKWRDSTPSDFQFVLKASQVITHEKVLENVEAEVTDFVTNASVLGDKLGGMLWQFPASLKAGGMREQLTQFLGLLPQNIQHTFEFRHESWFVEDVYNLLNQFNAGLVINDSPKFPQREVITGQIMYVRFHGPDMLYESLYSREQMAAWAERIKPKMDQYDVYLFFNNTTEGRALDNANTIQEMLR
jgi:uncharacterized protein YecE (DUF72 family)